MGNEDKETYRADGVGDDLDSEAGHVVCISFS